MFRTLKFLRANHTVRSIQVLSSARKRYFGVTSGLRHGEYEWQDPKSEDEVVNIIYIDKDGKKTNVRGKIGDNALYLAHRYGIEMEGCQIVLTKEMEGMQLSLPKATRNFYVDGHKPTPH